ncbi:mechanosensitive ion channel protein MscS [Citrobacter amalonaticus]|uniref:Mechanosensitive ion channel protein MscS n=1 Tax=Citrobacter amalonaticus TaxID=35703 RepID=A0A2S4S1B0_CITAM|nr:mechanosensitive ion channel family protein [Citrobacter amalonaticus]POT55185.1 mechanosensitive ion channel protein MscS [Citrobacter amalonaticus]POT77207.1 mechanosensitive ion channel protein MscS [Citrobacter amalonaticus]POU67658.1 mechanosensitive ion channel protein MscS [Citrobacter amalonaticus]POV07263.1 mechanosensitive ion channel protein MscS [Citrobacter amalonaticus]
MIAELFTKSAFDLAVIVISGITLVLMGIVYRRTSKKGFIFHAAQFLIYAIMISVAGGIANNLIDSYEITFITSGVIDFTCTSLIALILTVKLFLLINQFEKTQIGKGRDVTSARILSRIIKITIIIAIVLLYGEHFGMSLSGLLTFGGIGGIAVGMAGKDILSNFFSGIMLYFDRPFSIGDWIRSPDRNIEGTVTEIGWRITKINTFDHRPLYVPNSIFSSISVENPGRMSNRRINTVIGLRYEDAGKIGAVVDAVRQMLQTHEKIDQQQKLLVYFNGFGDSSLNIMVYCFTRTTVWEEWLAVQQEVYLKIIDIVQAHGADFAFPSQTLYIDNPASQPRAQ